MLALNDGEVFVAATVTPDGLSTDVAFARYSAAGELLDRVVVDLGSPRDRVFAAGNDPAGAGWVATAATFVDAEPARFSLRRFDGDGTAGAVVELVGDVDVGGIAAAADGGVIVCVHAEGLELVAARNGIFRFDAGGTLLWSAAITEGNDGAARFTSVAELADGRVVVAGETFGASAVVDAEGTTTPFQATKSGGFFVVLSSTGAFADLLNIGCTAIFGSPRLEALDDGGFVAGGYASLTLVFGSLRIAGPPRNAPWVARFDAALEPSWVRRFEPGQEGIVTAIATVPGGVAAVGWFRGGLDVDDVHLGSEGGTAYQPFAVAVDQDGDLVRASSLAAADQAMALTATSNGQRLLVGGVAAEDLVLADGRTLAASPFAAFVVDERLLIRGVVGP